MGTLSKVEENITTYKYVAEFKIDIVDNGEYYEAWLYEEHICHKMFMFGAPVTQHTKEEFEKIVERSTSHYIRGWYEELDDLEEIAELKWERNAAKYGDGDD